jgi:hypothetical protein
MNNTLTRRRLLQVMLGTGMGAVLPLQLTPAYGATPGRFWVTVNASGGWDPTLFIDPKGAAPRHDGRGPVNNYGSSIIKRAGNIPYASAYSLNVQAPAANSPGHFENFFQKHYPHLLVINGIDTETNNHESGSRFVWSGKLEEGYPGFSALVAAATAPELPLAFISNGGYDVTASLVASARVSGAGTFEELAYPNAASPGNEPKDRNPYFDDQVYAMIEQARTARLQRLHQKTTLPLIRQQMQELLTIRGEDNNLNRLVQALPERIADGIAGQAEIAIAAFSSGLAVSANLSMGGFDTHGNHDNNHSRQLTELLIGIDRLWDLIVQANLQNSVTVLVGSDFGRTPFYNNNDGKDHWNITSMMAMGAGVRGNRVLGGTDELVEALKLNPATLTLDNNGITLTPRHLHVALRALAGIPAELGSRFNIQAPPLNLFS